MAGDTPPEAWASYIEGWKERVRQERLERERWLREARRQARRLARILVREFGATRVLLVGSVATGRARRGSDLDLAVEGLPAEAYWKACARIEAATTLPVDLIDLDTVSAATAERLRREGVLLVERP